MARPNGWYRTLGVGAFYEKEYGDATTDGTGGMFTGYGFNQSRWGFDARYAIPAGEWVVVMPAIGYSRTGTDLQRMAPVMPSDCGAMSTSGPCFGDIKAAYLSADVHLRVGLTPTVALSLVAGYLQGLGVSRGLDQITAQAPASTNGFHADLGTTILVGNWFAVQATVPFRRYGFTFESAAGGPFTAKSATDMYYGLIVGLAVLTH